MSFNQWIVEDAPTFAALYGMGTQPSWLGGETLDYVGDAQSDAAQLGAQVNALRAKIDGALANPANAPIQGKLGGLQARTAMLQASVPMLAAGVGNYVQQVGEYNSINIAFGVAMAQVQAAAPPAPAPAAPRPAPAPAPAAPPPAPAPMPPPMTPRSSSGTLRTVGFAALGIAVAVGIAKALGL